MSEFLFHVQPSADRKMHGFSSLFFSHDFQICDVAKSRCDVWLLSTEHRSVGRSIASLEHICSGQSLAWCLATATVTLTEKNQPARTQGDFGIIWVAPQNRTDDA